MSKRKLGQLQELAHETTKAKRRRKEEEDADVSDVESEGEETEAESEDEDDRPYLEFPSTTVVIAKKFSGKTNLLLDMIEPEMFDMIYIFTASKHTGNLDPLVKDKMQIFDSCSEILLEKIMENQKEAFKKKGAAPSLLLIWDDFLGMKFKQAGSAALLELATSGRNSNISMWISSQDRVGILPQLRRNAEYWFLGNNTVKVIDDVSAEMAMATLGRQTMRDKLAKISRDKNYEFLFLDDRNQEDMVYKAEKMM
jgi:hypothetical protein